MRWVGYLTLGLVLLPFSAPATDRGVVGTLVRPATPARAARVAEIAKDASPPKAGGTNRPGDFRKDSKDARVVYGRPRR
jgi:hypothetical protein